MRSRILSLVLLLAACSGSSTATRSDVKPNAPVVFGEPLGSPPLDVVDGPPPTGEAPDLAPVADEVRRAMQELGEEENPPYFLAHQLSDDSSVTISASNGALTTNVRDRSRTVDVDVRVGSPELDNTRELRGQWAGDHFDWHQTLAPWDDASATQRALWRMTEDRYRDAAERYVEVVANQGVRAEEEQPKKDFSEAPVLTHIEPAAPLPKPDVEEWSARVRRLSELPPDADGIEVLDVTYNEDVSVRRLVNSEGSRVRKSRRVGRLSWYATATADDGMRVWLYDSIDVHDPADLPDEPSLRQRIVELVDRVVALRVAPVAEPYVGPVILEAEPAGVLFHEALGHRVEGHRQSDVDEGQTFAKKVGQQVLPTFLSVYDDPRARRVGSTDLMGHYRVDDEAVAARRASIVEDGVLTGFLMSRKPVPGFQQSNGHGRREEGKHVVARQGNLVIAPSHALTRDGLKELLLEEVERQELPYGLRIAKVRGGYTFTGRSLPQSFRLLPLLVYRVHPDGREELVRGANMDGTPLTVLAEIMAAGDDWGVFNGHCGAESGQVPVSSVSPSLLVRRLETSRGQGGADRPPVLGPPPQEAQ